MERYLYFTNPNDPGGNTPNATQELAMYPTSSLTNIFAASATTTTINFVPRDGTRTTEDVVTLTHADGDHKAVFNALVAMINAEKNNSPFNINGVTACAITSID